VATAVSTKTVWTIGHGDQDFDALAAALTRHRVQTIVDVRSEPYSKRAPDFTKAALEEFAASAGFGYRWMGSKLGGKPLATAEVFATGIDEVIGLSRSSQVVLLCAEANPVHCHRDKVLAPALVGRGFEVVHILADGAAMPYQEHLAI